MARLTKRTVLIACAALALGAAALIPRTHAPGTAGALGPADVPVAAPETAEAEADSPEAEAQEAAPADEKLRPEQRFVPVPSQGGANVYRAESPEERVAALLAAATVELSPEEQEMVREVGEDGLRGLIARAEHEMLNATDEDRPEKQRRYMMALNLVPKLDPAPDAEPQPGIKKAQEAYLAAAAKEQRAWARLGEEERRAARDAFKQRFFQENDKE